MLYLTLLLVLSQAAVLIPVSYFVVDPQKQWLLQWNLFGFLVAAAVGSGLGPRNVTTYLCGPSMILLSWSAYYLTPILIKRNLIIR